MIKDRFDDAGQSPRRSTMPDVPFHDGYIFVMPVFRRELTHMPEAGEDPTKGRSPAGQASVFRLPIDQRFRGERPFLRWRWVGS